MIIAVLMLYHFYFAIYRNPVGMHIKKTHENGNHDTLIVEISVLLHLFDDYHFAVGRSYHHLFGIFIEVSDRASVKIHHYGVTQPEYYSEYIKRYITVKAIEQNSSYSDDGYSSP